MEKLKKLILDYDFDIVGLTEVNKDWRVINHDETIWGATAGWKENRRIQISQNSTKKAETGHLIGGTATMVFNDVLFRITDQGEDKRKLGRWSNITLTGKNDLKTTIYTCYCPCKSSSVGSAYAQQLLYISEHKAQLQDVTCPRQLFGKDLRLELKSKLDAGHNILVQGDFNSNYEDLHTWMLGLGLENVIAKKHGRGPTTYNRSNKDAIDHIFGTANFNIQSGGFLAYGRLLSDHRGLWVDIPNHMLYGYNPPQPVFHFARRLKLKDPRVVSKYLTFLHSSMREHDVFYKMDNLHRRTVYPLHTNLAEEYELLDTLICTLMDKAEKQCRKLHTGRIPWSPTYKKCCQTLEYWLNRRSHFTNVHRNVRQLIVLQNKLSITYDPSLSLNEIETKIKSSYAERKRVKAIAESLSYEYRTELALAKEEAGEMKAATFIRMANQIESQRRMYRNIRHMEGKVKGGSTSKITVTSEAGHTVEYTSKKEIEKILIQENEKTDHQTEGGSQLLLPEFIKDVGHYGEGPRINDIMSGEYIPPNQATTSTKDFLATCTREKIAKEMAVPPDIVSRFKYQKTSWMTRKEKTCTNNHHIGHFKAIFKDKSLSWLFFQRADIPEISGYSPKRHSTCVDLMIMKKALCYDAKKQRKIGILDSEFNQNNKRMGRDAINNARQLNKIAPEQFAKKGTASIDQTICKRCMIDHHKSKRLCFALTSSDLAGCYDRILHSAAALALLRVGISHNRIKSMFASIQKMIHKIRTAFGDSEISFGGEDIGDWENFPQGVLQGNASGPAIWSILSSVIFEILHKRGFATEFCTSLSKECFLLVGFSYVDDCDLVQSGTNPRVLLHSMQELIQSWGSLMEVTGGALSVSKSWWYLIEYVWKRGKWEATDAGNDLDLVAKDTSGNIVSLKRLHCHESSKMLGVWIAPDGNQVKLIEELKKIPWNGAIKQKWAIHLKQRPGQLYTLPYQQR